jgi:hypothetical protein
MEEFEERNFYIANQLRAERGVRSGLNETISILSAKHVDFNVDASTFLHLYSDLYLWLVNLFPNGSKA